MPSFSEYRLLQKTCLDAVCSSISYLQTVKLSIHTICIAFMQFSTFWSEIEQPNSFVGIYPIHASCLFEVFGVVLP